MNIEHLKLFIRLATTHNISLAGQELGLSPAVASAHINKLEQTLGTRLVHRTTRKVSLTEEGLSFLPHAEEVLATVETAKASIGAGHSCPSGTLRVTAPASFGRMHLIPALNDFMAKYPDISIDFRLSDSIVDLVEGGFDVAIRNAALKDSSLIAKKITPDHRIICASPAYLAEHGTPQIPAGLYDHQLISLSSLDSWGLMNNGELENIKIKPQFKTDNGEAVRDACVNGLGITISSTWCVYQHLQRGELVQVLDQYPLASDSALWMVYPSSRLLAPKVRVFIDYFVEYFGHPVYWDQQI